MEGAEGNTEICEIIKTGKNLKKMIISLVQHEIANYFWWGVEKKDPILDYIFGLSLILSLSTINYSWWP